MGFPFLILTAVGFCFLDETPAFLYCQHQYKQCKEVIRTITRINQRPEFKFNLLEEMNQVNSRYTTAMEIVGGKAAVIRPKRDSSYFSVISDNVHMQNASVQNNRRKISKVKLFRKHYRLFFLWAVHYFAYFGFPLLIGGGTKLILNFTLLGSTELLGILLSAKLLTHFNYVRSMKVFVFFCLLTCVLFYFFDKYFFFLIILKPFFPFFNFSVNLFF